MPPDSLLSLICKCLARDYTSKEGMTALGLIGMFLTKEHNILAMLLHQYQSYRYQHDSLLRYRKQLYILAADGGRTELL